MLFLDDHIQAVLPDLMARREACDAMIGCMSAGEVMRLTRLGRFAMREQQAGAISPPEAPARLAQAGQRSAGARQMEMLRQLPRILRFIPGTAQDVRAYFLTHAVLARRLGRQPRQPWRASSSTATPPARAAGSSRLAAGRRAGRVSRDRRSITRR